MTFSHPPSSLHTQPTVNAWVAELTAVLEGRRDSDIEQLADAAEYTEDQISLSKSPWKSRNFLRTALDRTVSAWTPSAYDDSQWHVLLFELLGHYTPRKGFPKLIRFVQLRDAAPDRGNDDRRRLALLRAALFALEAYFPAPPLVTKAPSTKLDAAFDAYVLLLRSLAARSEHAAYGLRALFRLGVGRLDDRFTFDTLTTWPHGVRGILQYILNLWRARPSHMRSALSDLYETCLRLGLSVEEHFRLELASLRGTFQDGPTRPRVRLPRCAEWLTLELSQDAEIDYTGISERRTNNKPRQRIQNAITRAKTKSAAYRATKGL